MRLRRTAAVAVAMALVASGCSSDSGGEAGGASSGSPVTIDLLAGAGIAVFARPEDPEPLVPPAEPVSPVRLLEWQFHNLAAQTGGLTAAQLDDAVPGVEVGEREIPTSALIAAWAEEFDTAAAAHAREVLAGPPDWPDEVPSAARPVYTDLVLTLFASDIATVGAGMPEPPAQPEPPAGGGGGASAAAVDIGRACQAVVGFSANVRAAVANALNRLIINPKPVSTGVGLFDTLVNTVVQGAAGLFNMTVKAGQILVDGVFQATVGEVLGFVARVAGVVGTLAEVTNFVKPWTVTLHEKDPAINQLGVRPAAVGLPGTLTARVTVSFDKWPGGIEKCAQSVGRDLPDLKPSGNKVKWKLDGFENAPIPLAAIDEARTERTLAPGGTARLAYHTGVEDPPKPDAEDDTGLGLFSVHIERDDIRKLEDLFNKLVNDVLSGALPLSRVPFVRELVANTARKLLTRITSGVTAALAKIRRTYDVAGFVAVRFHKPGDDKTDGSIESAQPPAHGRKVCDLLTDGEIGSILGFKPDTVEPAAHDREGHDLSEEDRAELGLDSTQPPGDAYVRTDACTKGFNYSVSAKYKTHDGGTNTQYAFESDVGWAVHTYTDQDGPRDWIAELLRLEASLPKGPENVRSVHLDVGDEAVGSQYNEVVLDGEKWRTTGKVNFQGRIEFRVGNLLVFLWGHFDQGAASLTKKQCIQIGKIIADRLR